jgi:hypothetical protein
MSTKRLFAGYILLAVLYVLVKVIYVATGYLHPGAILHGLIPAVLTLAVAVLALRAARRRASPQRWLRWMAILPVLVLVTTPIYMYLMQRAEWLADGRLSVLVIYEALAVLQFLLALGIRRRSTG